MTADADENVAPITYRIDRDRHVVSFTLRGDVTFAGLCAALDDFLDDPAYDPGMPVYVDVRVVTSIPTAEQIRKLALDRLLRANAAPTGRAAIVAMTPLGMEYANSWELFSDSRDRNIAVFTSPAEAHAWLGVPPPTNG